MKWLKESNRLKHFWYGIPVGLIGTILMAFGVAIGMEYKDKLKGGEFDWLDILSTMLGGIVGQALQVGLYFFIKTVGLATFGVAVGVHLVVAGIFVFGMLGYWKEAVNWFKSKFKKN